MEQFIAAIRQHPCLWDVSHKDYRNPEERDAAWRDVVHLRLAQIRNVSEAKAEWKKLRDNHRDSLKRMKSANCSKNNWRYADLMEFLLPYMKHRKKRRYGSCIDAQSPNNPDEQEEYNNDDYFETSVHTPTDDTLNYTVECGAPIVDEAETTNRGLDNELMELLKDVRQNQRKRQQEREAIRELTNKQQEKHPIDLFMASMATSVKEMPTWMQIRVKRKIFAIISEAEDDLEYSVPIASANRLNTANASLNSN